MKYIRNLSFKRKLLLYAVATTSVALVLCCSAVIIMEWNEHKESLPRDLRIRADIIAANATASLAFNDHKSASEILHGLQVDNNIVSGCVCNQNGIEFAKYTKSASLADEQEVLQETGHLFTEKFLHIRRPIVLDNEDIGWVYLRYDLQEYNNVLKNMVAIIAVCMIIALAGAYLVSARLQSILTRPVFDLMNTASRVANDKDYSIRTTKHSSDELGMLTDAFNEMLETIQQRDVALQKSHDTLEERVKDRTFTLAQRERQQAVIAELGQEALKNTSLSTLFDCTVKRVAQTLEIELVKILELNTEKHSCFLRSGIGWQEGLVGHASVGIEQESQAGYTLLCEQPVVVEDLTTETRFSGPTLLHDHQVISGLSLVIPGYTGPWGVIGVHSTKKRSFTKEDINFFKAVTNVLAAAIHRRKVEQELVQAKRVADDANQSKTEFLANMSHEIRTPMTAILGYTDIMIDHCKRHHAPAEQLDASLTIKRNGEHLLDIINDILDLSKIEAGELSIEYQKYSPCTIIADILSLMRTRAQAKNLNLSVEYNGMIPETILTDQLRIRQILINLVNNAIKFTDHGEVRILVELLQPQSSTSQLQIDVVDTGIGIPANQLDQMFEPFIQADTSSTRNYEGTGLGLTISRKLATMLGGGISAISEFGKGSTFRLTLSIGSLDGVKLVENPNEIIAVDHDENTQSSPAMSQHVPDHLDCRILLVEDGIDNQRLISTILTNTGAQVEIAENGKIAVELVSKVIGNSRLFDLILMDMQMPVMDGYEATQLLREMGYNRPIIALTAHAMAGDREKCLAAGCSDYATKPIKRIDLIQLVSTHIQRQGNALPV